MTGHCLFLIFMCYNMEENVFISYCLKYDSKHSSYANQSILLKLLCLCLFQDRLYAKETVINFKLYQQSKKATYRLTWRAKRCLSGCARPFFVCFIITIYFALLFLCYTILYFTLCTITTITS